MPKEKTNHNGGSVGARVLREVIRTPTFRELIRLNLGAFDSDAGKEDPKRSNAGEVVRALMREDMEVFLSLVGATPQTINAAIDSALELGRGLAGLPDGLRDAYIARIIEQINTDQLRELPRVWTPILTGVLPNLLAPAFEGIRQILDATAQLPAEQRARALRSLFEAADGHAIGEAVNAGSALMILLHRENAELPEGAGENLRRIVEGIDFGKLRVALVGLSGYARQAGKQILAQAMGDPAAAANLLLVLPPLINDGMELFDVVLETLDLPDEILASGIFNILREIDFARLGHLAMGIVSLVNTTHRGNLVLGLTEPAFRPIAVDLMDQFLSTFDLELAGHAAVAMGEDLEMFSTVFADLLRRDPLLAKQLAKTGAQVFELLLRSAAHVLHEASQLPRSELETIGASVRIDPKTIGQLINSAIVCANRIQTEVPKEKTLQQILDAIDWNRLGLVARRSAAAFSHMALKHEGIKKSFQPKVVGRLINSQLKRFNRFMASDPEARIGYLRAVLAEVDSAVLEQSWHSMVALLSELLSARTDRTRALDRPIIARVFAAARRAADTPGQWLFRRRSG